MQTHTQRVLNQNFGEDELNKTSRIENIDVLRSITFPGGSLHWSGTAAFTEFKHNVLEYSFCNSEECWPQFPYEAAPALLDHCTTSKSCGASSWLEALGSSY